MASKGKKKPSLADLTKKHLSEDDKPLVLKELFESTDRSAALVAASLVDFALVSALRSHFIPMGERDSENLFYGPNATLSSFASRIEIAYASGIFGSQLHNMLDVLRRVRNVFAHSIRPLTFDDPTIVTECQKLPNATLAQLFRNPPQDVNNCKARYISVCMNIVVIFEDYAARKRGPMTIDIPNGTGSSPAT